MNSRFFARKTPPRKKKRRNWQRKTPNVLRKRSPIIISPDTSRSVFGKILHEKIKILSKATNLASGEKFTPEEIGRILGMHPVEVREIQEMLRKKESYNYAKNFKKKH